MNFGFHYFDINFQLPYSNNLPDDKTLNGDGLSTVWNFLQKDKKFKGKPKIIDKLIEDDENFFYLLDIPYPFIYNYNILSNFYLPEKVHEAVKANKCKVIFGVFMEPPAKEWEKSLIQLARNYNLKKENLFILTGDNNYKTDSELFTAITYNYFLSCNLFLDTVQDNDKFLFTEIKHKLKNEYPYTAKFLCLNRISRSHRLYFYYKLLQQPTLTNNTLISLASKSEPAFMDALHYELTSWVKDKKERDKIFNFFKYRKIDIFIDDLDKNFNAASNLTIELLNSTFISIITETDVESERLFLSEKIAKGLYSKQPFIVFGNPGTLSYLKKLGFKTFNRWFDESYDGETDVVKRVNKILGLMGYLNTFSHKELYELRNKMKSVLEHNQKKIIEYSETNLFEKLNIYNK